MKTLTVLWLCSATACLAQVTVSLSNGVTLRIETSFGQPTGQQVVTAEMRPASGNSFYRIFRDQTGLAVFAYKLTVDRQGEDEYRLLLQPAGIKLGNEDGGKPPPTFPAERSIGPLESGKPVPIEVFKMEGLGENVLDTATLEINAEPQSDEGPLHFDGLKVYVNQALVSNRNLAEAVSGTYAMFYIPGRGGYFFSAHAAPGFVEAGSIDGRRMTFTSDNVNIECVAEKPILAGSERGEIWVKHDPNYQPQGRWTEPLGSESPRAAGFFEAASNTLSWWMAPEDASPAQ